VQTVAPVRLADAPVFDAFGRLRTADPYTLFDSSMTNDKQPLLWDDVTATGGTVVYTNAQAACALTVTSSAGSSSARQSRQYSFYQPGKSLLVLMTFVMGSAASGVRKRVGYFDADNGFFLQQYGDAVAIVKRSKTTGSVVETVVAQADWSVDTLDGQGPSGITLDLSKAQILALDLEWLGVGRVRVGFVIGGSFVYVHEFLHANVEAGVYISRASLPCRYEITNVSGGSTGTLTQICAMVSSEGGFNPPGVVRAASNARTAVACAASDTLTPVLAIRLQSAYVRGSITPLSLDVLNTSNNNAYYEAWIRSTLTGGAWSAVSDAAERNVTMTAASGGLRIACGYLSSQSRGVTTEFDSRLTITGDVTGASDILVIAAAGVTATSDIRAAISWREVY
jgi:hypothetical protein